MLPFIRKRCKEIVASVDSNLVASYLRLLHTFLGEHGVDLKKANLPFPEKTVLTYVFFCAVWSLGANLHDKSRREFGDKLRMEMKKKFNDLPDGDVYDFGIDKEVHKLEPWNDQVPQF